MTFVDKTVKGKVLERMLSDTDIKRELGRNLFIYPLKGENIKGASINLSASRFAWSLETKCEIVKNGQIIIPPHDTGLIETEETVAITGRLAGTYHSRVKSVSMGTGHIGTTMNPYWIGHSLIAIHNHTDQAVKIPVGSPFVTLVLYYLNRKAKRLEDNSPGREDILQDFSLSDEAKDWLYEQPHAKNRKALKKIMKESPEYGELTSNELKRKGRVILLALGLMILLWVLTTVCSSNGLYSQIFPMLEIMILMGLLVAVSPSNSAFERLFSVGFSGFIIVFLMEILSLLRLHA